jgi:hypothetical protein
MVGEAHVAMPRVTKSITATAPVVQPTARRVPRRLKAQIVACPASSRMSSMISGNWLLSNGSNRGIFIVWAYRGSLGCSGRRAGSGAGAGAAEASPLRWLWGASGYLAVRYLRVTCLVPTERARPAPSCSPLQSCTRLRVGNPERPRRPMACGPGM